jgi:hypothetical protein
MRQFHFYDASTGLFHSSSVVINAPFGHEETAQKNCPAGHNIIEGVFDPLCQRVDLATGQVIDYQPPAPSTDHEWNSAAKRWELSPAAQSKAEARAAASARIAELEASQHRHVRDLLLGSLSARPRLQAIGDEITKLTADL